MNIFDPIPARPAPIGITYPPRVRIAEGGQPWHRLDPLEDVDEDTYQAVCAAGGDTSDIPRSMTAERAEEIRRHVQATLHATTPAPRPRLFGVPPA